MPQLRQLKVQQAIDDNNIDKAVELLKQGIKEAQDNNEHGILDKWLKQLMMLAYQHNLPKLVQEYGYQLIFHNNRLDIDNYQFWQDSFSAKDWQQEIAIKQNLLLAEVTKQKEDIYSAIERDTKNCIGINTGRANSNLAKLAVLYDHEQQDSDLLNLLKKYPQQNLLDQYCEKLASLDSDWLINHYRQYWQQQVEKVDGRKEYNALAQHIRQIAKRVPKGKENWQKMVYAWQQRFSQHPRKPALLDELGKIDW